MWIKGREELRGDSKQKLDFGGHLGNILFLEEKQKAHKNYTKNKQKNGGIAINVILAVINLLYNIIAYDNCDILNV